jgi:hypothetical protein
MKKISESFKHRFREKDDLISLIFGLTEDELLESLSDVEDEHEVEIECFFYLKTPAKKLIAITPEESSEYDEKIEALAASGSKPIIEIVIRTSDDTKFVRSTLMDSLKRLVDWTLEDYGSTTRSKITITLEQVNDENRQTQEQYHKKINSFFSDYFGEFKKFNYVILIDKLFEHKDRFYARPMINLKSEWTKKLYGISLEKKYINPDLPMFDELAQVKACLATCLTKLKEVKDFYDLSYDFEIIDTKDEEKIIEVIFTISVYEK